MSRLASKMRRHWSMSPYSRMAISERLSPSFTVYVRPVRVAGRSGAVDEPPLRTLEKSARGLSFFSSELLGFAIASPRLGLFSVTFHRARLHLTPYAPGRLVETERRVCETHASVGFDLSGRSARLCAAGFRGWCSRRSRAPRSFSRTAQGLGTS